MCTGLASERFGKGWQLGIQVSDAQVKQGINGFGFVSFSACAQLIIC
jgi:hypothetical protein